MSGKSDRGMVKWAPYQSLVEQASSLAKMRKKKSWVPKPLISSEEAADINKILTSYDGEEVIASYWVNGQLLTLNGFISKIDATFGYLKIGSAKIAFSSLVALKDAK